MTLSEFSAGLLHSRAEAPAAADCAAVVPVDDDVRAISAALTLCAFLWFLKAFLIGWFLIEKQINPLSDAPIDGALALGGADLLLCAIVAVVYRALLALGRRAPQPLNFLLRSPATLFIHAALVIFSVASLEVTRVYGWPLEVAHLRSADDPRIIASSIGAYAGLIPCTLIIIGLLMRPLLGRVFRPLISRAFRGQSRLRLWIALGIATAALSGMWAFRLRQIDTFGVKQNAVVFFIVHYTKAPGALDIQRTLNELTPQSKAHEAEMLDPQSIRTPGESIARDFNVVGDAKGMNVLVIQMESTSAQWCDEKTTPNLMKLAQHGVSFTRHATVYGETTRATYGIYYSDYMTDLGTTPRMLYGKRFSPTSLPEVVRAAGYQTAVFNSTFLSYADLGYMFRDKGIDILNDASNLWMGQTLPWSWGVPEEQTVSALTKWIRQRKGEPFFAIYGTAFPHHPYTCPTDDKPYPETSWLSRYRNSLHYADKNVGTLLEDLAAIGCLDKTLIVVVGDHGESVSSYPVGHGLALTREEVFVPFILSNPKLFPTAIKSELSTNHLDIAPTVARLIGLKPSKQWLGRNLLDDKLEARLMFIQAKLAQVQGVIDNGLIYVYETNHKRERLFDTSSRDFKLLPEGDPRSALLPQYHNVDALFQKWAVWHHMARAASQLPATTEPAAQAAFAH